MRRSRPTLLVRHFLQNRRNEREKWTSERNWKIKKINEEKDRKGIESRITGINFEKLKVKTAQVSDFSRFSKNFEKNSRVQSRSGQNHHFASALNVPSKKIFTCAVLSHFSPKMNLNQTNTGHFWKLHIVSRFSPILDLLYPKPKISHAKNDAPFRSAVWAHFGPPAQLGRAPKCPFLSKNDKNSKNAEKRTIEKLSFFAVCTLCLILTTNFAKRKKSIFMHFLNNKAPEITR